MAHPLIRRFRDADQLTRAAAEEFVRLAQQALDERGRFTVALSGGPTPRRLYQLLASSSWSSQIQWEHVHLFWGDERAVGPEHPESNYRMAHESMIEKLAIPNSNVHRMAAEREDRDQAARDYQTEIARVFEVSPEGEPPVLDLVLLGMGSDGHTASLFPGTAALDETTRWVVPNFVAKLGAHRLTLTVLILNRAACVMFLVAGSDKAEPLVEVIEGPRDPERLPAQLINPVSGKLLWLVDDAAATELKSEW